jgi:hypothetical protein
MIEPFSQVTYFRSRGLSTEKAAGYLKKPFTLADLLAVVDRFCPAAG